MPVNRATQVNWINYIHITKGLTVTFTSSYSLLRLMMRIIHHRLFLGHVSHVLLFLNIFTQKTVHTTFFFLPTWVYFPSNTSRALRQLEHLLRPANSLLSLTRCRADCWASRSIQLSCRHCERQISDEVIASLIQSSHARCTFIWHLMA